MEATTTWGALLAITALTECVKVSSGYQFGYSIAGFLLVISKHAKPTRTADPNWGLVTCALSLIDARIGIFAYVAEMLTVKQASKFKKPANAIIKHSMLGSEKIGAIVAQYMGYLYIEAFGDTLRADFHSTLDLHAEVLDEFTALRDITTAEQMMRTSYDLSATYGPHLGAALLAFLAWGPPGFFVAIVLSYYAVKEGPNMRAHKNIDEPLMTRDVTQVNIPEGTYMISHNVFGYTMHLGVGYSDGTTLYTMYHVAGGRNPIEVAGTILKPSYVNVTSDVIAYGGAPKIARISDGAEVTVALCSHLSATPVIYRSKASKNANGTIFLKGNRSIHGSSGSPIFVYEEEVVTHGGEEHLSGRFKFAGCAGWYADINPEKDPDDMKRVGTEIIQECRGALDVGYPLNDNDVMQIFDHCGSGKTWSLIPSLTTSGLIKYGRVYVSGPSLTVCNEIYRALNEHNPGKVSKLTSEATIFERGTYARPIIVAAHATMMSLMQKGHYSVCARGLWIIDEAHCVDVSTMCLVDTLRHRSLKERKCTVVELTATGYNLQTQSYEIKTNTNHEVEDIVMTSDEMLTDMFVRAKEHKVLVFTESITGKGNSMLKLASKATKEEIPYVNISRATFATQYHKARDLETGIVFTTDISECGANYPGLHAVYDFQRAPKMIANGMSVNLESRFIDQGQRTQRRGRVGRTQPGLYISPGYDLVIADLHRVEFRDRHIYCKSMNIECLEPRITDDDMKLSPGQVRIWLGAGIGGLSSPWLIDAFYHTTGIMISGEQRTQVLKRWLTGQGASTQINGKALTCSFWDERDRDILERMYRSCTGSSIEQASMFNRLMKIGQKVGSRIETEMMAHHNDPPTLDDQDIDDDSSVAL